MCHKISGITSSIGGVPHAGKWRKKMYASPWIALYNMCNTPRYAWMCVPANVRVFYYTDKNKAFFCINTQLTAYLMEYTIKHCGAQHT